MNIFISHSSEDAKIANNLCNAIEQNGYKCFIAPRDIRTGYEYAAEIADGIDNSKILVLLLSKASNASPHVLREVERAVTKSIPVLVYKLEDVELSKSLEYFLMTHQWLNAKKNNFSDILESISQISHSMQNENEAFNASIPPASSLVSKPAKSKLLPILIVIIAVLCISTIILIVIFLQSKNSNNDKDNETNSSAQTTDTIEATDGETTTANKDSNSESTEINLGDTVTLGTYNDEPIEWKVIKISDDGKSAVMISKYILSFKGYDAPDSGTYNKDKSGTSYYSTPIPEGDLELEAFVRGSNRWSTSTIRAWLNSSEENVTYDGQIPISTAFADGSNGYELEPGFLHFFTDEEQAALIEAPITTNTVEFDGNIETETTNDKVFLISRDETQWLKEANVPMLCEPTDKAIALNQTFWYQDYCVDFNLTTSFWWLREPVSDSSSQCYLADYGKYNGEFYPWEVGVEDFGIRPAINVDLTSDCIVIE